MRSIGIWGSKQSRLDEHMDQAHFQRVWGGPAPVQQGNDLETIAFASGDLCSEEGNNARATLDQSHTVLPHSQQSQLILFPDGPNHAASLSYPQSSASVTCPIEALQIDELLPMQQLLVFIFISCNN